jgi:decaprenylphospho-beta-D-erythro-pentofuranosid-2-ulose 2-reductase
MSGAKLMVHTAVSVGGGSDLSRAILSSLVNEGLDCALLAGKSSDTLDLAAAELSALSVTKVETERLDVTETQTLDDFAERAACRIGEIDLVLIAAGALGTSKLEELDAPIVASLATTNFTGPAAVMMAFARVLRAQGHGTIVVLSSVAGYRVRSANLVYGAAKAALDGFALGLGDALAGSGVKVIVVRPGFVRTKMTAGRQAAPLAIEPYDVARAVVRGLRNGTEVVWVPRALQYVFWVFRLLPRSIWRRIRT